MSACLFALTNIFATNFRRILGFSLKSTQFPYGKTENIAKHALAINVSGNILLKLINNSSSQLQITACIPHHVHVFAYPMKNWMKIFKDLDIVSKSLEIWIQYPNVH